MQTIPEDRSAAPSGESALAARGETLNEVLATQARSRTRLELWAGTMVGAANAVLIWTRFPSLRWLAAGFAATACYGAWGLIDQKLAELDQSIEGGRFLKILMQLTRVLAGGLGWVWAL